MSTATSIRLTDLKHILTRLDKAWEEIKDPYAKELVMQQITLINGEIEELNRGIKPFTEGDSTTSSFY